MAVRNLVNSRIATQAQWGPIAFLLAGVLFSLVVISLVAFGEGVSELAVETAIAIVFILVGAGLLAFRLDEARMPGQFESVGLLGVAVGIVGGAVILGLLALLTADVWASVALVGGV